MSTSDGSAGSTLGRREEADRDEDEGAPGCMPERDTGKVGLAQHAWENHHPIKWEEATVID